MSIRLLPVFFALLITGCSISPIFPPDSGFTANLTLQNDGGTQCNSVKPAIDMTSGNDETITLGFAHSLKILEIVPEGDRREDHPVIWSYLATDNTTRLALLVEPETLEVGKIKHHVNKQVCVDFKPELFSETDDYERFNALSGVICCGTLIGKQLQ